MISKSLSMFISTFSSMIIYLFAFTAVAQQIKPLYSTNSFKTQVSIPFTLVDSELQPITIVKLAFAQPSTNCRLIKDPFMASNFFIKCSSPEKIQPVAYFKNGESYHKITYNLIDVTSLATSGTSVPPGGGNTGGDTYKIGRDLYSQRCASCHQSAYEKQNRTQSQISQAINNISSMRSIVLTASEVQAISDYLSHLP